MPYKSKEDQAKYLKERYERLKSAGLCVDCGDRVVSGTLCEKHRLHQLALQTNKAKDRMEKKICVYCGKKPSVTSMHCEDCRKKVNRFREDFNSRQFDLVLDHYGRECECCGETEPLFLTIDHVNGGGSKHRREEGSHTYALILREKKKIGEWPSGYRILCHNCNCGRWRNGGICPHNVKGDGNE